MRADRPLWQVHALGDLAMRPALQVVQEHDFPPVLRQRAQRAEEVRPHVGTLGIARGGSPSCRFGDRFEPDYPAVPFVPQVVQGVAPDDLAEPPGEPGGVATVVDSLDRIDEGVLARILGARDVPDDGERDRPAAAQVPLRQPLRGIAAPLPHALHQLGIGRIRRHWYQGTWNGESVEGSGAHRPRPRCFQRPPSALVRMKPFDNLHVPRSRRRGFVPRVIATAMFLAASGIQQSTAAQAAPRRLEPADCAFAQEEWAQGLRANCRWMIVPLDRNQEQGPNVRLFVVILPAGRPSGAPPLVLLHGGPGESALLRMVRGARAQEPLVRDVVIYDQRGAGLSQPDPCPGYAARLRDLDSKEPMGGTGRRSLQIVARECVADMQASGIDPAAFTTTANAADLADLRLALGYERWDIMAASYGARLALEAMRRDPRGIASVVLENPVPPGPETAEAALATQRALERVFAACGRTPECHAAFPAPEQAFEAVFDTLSRRPISAPAAEGAQRIVLDGEVFVLGVRRTMRSREGIALLPLLLYELRAGDRLRAARELLRLAEGTARADRAVFWLVQCFDQHGPGYAARLDSVGQVVWRPMRSLRDNLQECPIWQTRSATRAERAPVASDIRTLVVTGEFDPRTPIEFGRRIASTLSRSHVVELPGETHGGRPGACRAEIIARFLNDPEKQPDTTCITRMQSIQFRTTWPQ